MRSNVEQHANRTRPLSQEAERSKSHAKQDIAGAGPQCSSRRGALELLDLVAGAAQICEEDGLPSPGFQLLAATHGVVPPHIHDMATRSTYCDPVLQNQPCRILT